MALQTDYPATLAIGKPGQIANTEANNIISATIVGGPVAFGLAATRGAADNTAKLGGTVFYGISVRDRAVEGTSVDAFAVGMTGGFMATGAILVTAGEAVVAGDAAGFIPATGALMKAGTTGATAILGAEFDASGAAGAIVRLRIR